MPTDIVTQMTEHSELRPLDFQEQVLRLVRWSEYPVLHGVSGKKLSQFIGTISESDLQLMSQSIKEGCTQVDIDGW